MSKLVGGYAGKKIEFREVFPPPKWKPIAKEKITIL